MKLHKNQYGVVLHLFGFVVFFTSIIILLRLVTPPRFYNNDCIDHTVVLPTLQTLNYRKGKRIGDYGEKVN